MATKNQKDPKDDTQVVQAIASINYSEKYESIPSCRIRDLLEVTEQHLKFILDSQKAHKKALVDCLVHNSGLKVGSIVELRRVGKVKIVDFYLDYNTFIERDILHFHYQKLNKDGSPNKKESSRYNCADVLQIEGGAS